MKRAVAGAGAALLFLAACGSDGNGAADPSATPRAARSDAATTSESPGSSGDVAPAAPSPTSPMTVGDVVARTQSRLDAVAPSSPGLAVRIDCSTPDRPVERGDVFSCNGVAPAPGLEDSMLAFLVLDDGGATSMLSGTDLPDLEVAYAGVTQGLRCRDLLADRAGYPFDVSGTSDRTAAFLATAYWFLEGMPARMDADGDGIPCESVFSPDAVTWVWNGGQLTGSPA